MDTAGHMQWMVDELPVVLSRISLTIGGAALLLAAVVRWASKGLGSL